MLIAGRRGVARIADLIEPTLVTLAVRSGLNDIFCQDRPCGLSVSSRIKLDAAALNGLPRFVQCGRESLNFLGIKHPFLLVEIPVHFNAPSLRPRSTSASMVLLSEPAMVLVGLKGAGLLIPSPREGEKRATGSAAHRGGAAALGIWCCACREAASARADVRSDALRRLSVLLSCTPTPPSGRRRVRKKAPGHARSRMLGDAVFVRRTFQLACTRARCPWRTRCSSR